MAFSEETIELIEQYLEMRDDQIHYAPTAKRERAPNEGVRMTSLDDLRHGLASEHIGIWRDALRENMMKEGAASAQDIRQAIYAHTQSKVAALEASYTLAPAGSAQRFELESRLEVWQRIFGYGIERLWPLPPHAR